MPNVVGVPSQGTQQQQLTRLDSGQLVRATPTAQLRNGALVTGSVLNVTKDGAYLVNIQNGAGFSQNLTARATLPLIMGQNFRAIWDNSGETPILRLSEEDFALLSKFGEGGDRDIATALLARGMPVTGDVINFVRMMWRKGGEDPAKLGSLLELWGRDLPMTPGNMQIISWYMSLDKKNLAQIWNKVRAAFKERMSANKEDALTALKNLMDGDDDVADFLRGHSMLSKPLKHGVDVNAMAGAMWAVGDDADEPLFAKIWVSSNGDERTDKKSWWQVGFEMDGNALDTVEGEVESDAQSYVVGLRTDEEAAYQLLRLRRDALRRELDDIPMSLQHIGVTRGKKSSRAAGRSIDIKV